MCPVARLNFGRYISTHTCSFSRISVTTTVLSQVQFSLFLFPLGVTTADHLPPYHLCMSSFMTSTNLLSSFFNILCPVFALLHLCTCPNHLNLASQTLSCSSDALLSALWAVFTYSAVSFVVTLKQAT